MVYIRILALHNLQTAGYYFFLVMHKFIYVLPFMAVVAVYSATLGR
jgi:hypothetical protein